MGQSEERLAAFVQSADLKGTRATGLWGLRQGYPVFFSFTDGSAQSDLLIHLRYPPHEFVEGEEPELKFEAPLPALMDAGLAEVEIHDDIAWLTLKRADDRFAAQEVVPAIDAVIACLQSLGIVAVPGCHYCGGDTGVAVLVSLGRVGQICTSCVEKQIGRDLEQRDFRARALLPLALITPIVLVLQSLLWGGIWLGLDWLAAKAGGRIAIPQVVAMAAVAVLAGLAASPALLFRLVTNRGNRRAALLAAVCALAALAFGEALHAASVLGSWRYFLVLLIHPDLTLKIGFSGGDGLFVVLKLLIAVGFIVAAAAWAKSKQIVLRL